MSEKNRLVRVTIDEASLGRGSADQEHERAVAIFDLVERNHFALPDFDGGPYAVHLALVERRLALEIRDGADAALITHHLSLTPLKRIIKDYALLCESYYAAIRTATPSRIEAIDMGRRGLHDEAATKLAERLAGKVEIDHDTARRLFTLIYALHWKG